MIKLHDLFIGAYDISQGFGVNPTDYSWIKDINGNSIQGHNGLDIKTPSTTVLLNPFPDGHNVVVSYQGEDPRGYGNFIRIWDKTQGCVILYAHCQEFTVETGDELWFQQKIGYTDNTGWSTGPHLHVGLYMVDAQGNKINRDNGYDGYINMGDTNLVSWEVFNPKEPSLRPKIDNETNTAMPDLSKYPVFAKTFEGLVGIADKYKAVMTYMGITDRKPEEVSANELIDQLKKEHADTTYYEDRIKNVESENIILQVELKNRVEQVERLKADYIVMRDKFEEDIALMKQVSKVIDDGKRKLDAKIQAMLEEKERVEKEKGILIEKLMLYEKELEYQKSGIKPKYDIIHEIGFILKNFFLMRL